MAKKTNAEVRKKSRTARIQAKEKELIKAGIPQQTAKIYASRDPGRAKMEEYIKEHKQGSLSIPPSQRKKQPKEPGSAVFTRKNKAAEKRINEKYWWMVNRGVEEKTARRLAAKDTNWKSIKDIAPDGLYIAEKYLGVLLVNPTGEVDILRANEESKYLSTDRMIKDCETMYRFSMLHTTGYVMNIIYIFVSTKQANDAAMFKMMQNRPDVEMVRLVNSNKFDLQKFVRVLYVGCVTTNGLHTQIFYESMRKYARDYLPEIYKKVF